MKIILINPISRFVKNHKILKKFLTPIPPLGIASIAAVLEKNNYTVKIIDQFAKKISNEGIVQIINQENPDMVGFSCLTPAMKDVKETCALIKKSNPKIKIVLGNTHATFFAREILEESYADFILRGPAEYSMLELVKQLETKKNNLSDIPGISYINSYNTIIHNNNYPVIDDLDNLPHPAFHLLDINDYHCFPLIGLKNKKFLPISGSRGCPYNCIFCAQEVLNKKPSYRKTKKIIDEIEYLHNKLKVQMFIMTDAFFPFSIESGMEFCDEYIKRGLTQRGVTWGTENRVDLLNKALLKKMYAAGCRFILYGLESGNAKILNTAQKRATLEQAIQAVRHTKEAGILTIGLFVIGLPGETRKTILETIKFSKYLDCDIVKFNLVVPYPGSQFYYKYCNKEMALKHPERFNCWVDIANSDRELIYKPKGMTSKELIYLRNYGMFSYYLRPRIILKHLLRGSFRIQDMLSGALEITTSILKMKK